MVFCLIFSIIVFGILNQKLIDKDLFEITKQDATYYDPLTMNDKKDKVNEKSIYSLEKENAVKDQSSVEIINKIFSPSNDVVKNEEEKQPNIVIIDEQER